jgi:hypothetical protein
LKGVLGGHEFLDALVLVGLILQSLEAADFGRLKLGSAAVTLFQTAAQGHDVTIEGHGLLVCQEALGRIAGGLDVWIGGDGGAKGFDLGGDSGG